MAKVNPEVWQTDTSIGDWYYNRNWKFRPVSWVIHMLVDNVSKNGNLLLNVVQRPDGSLDPEVEKMLEQLADWNAIHAEYDQRGKDPVFCQCGDLHRKRMRKMRMEPGDIRSPLISSIASSFTHSSRWASLAAISA